MEDKQACDILMLSSDFSQTDDWSKLFPPLPEDYFDDKIDFLFDDSTKHSNIKPYIKRRDLNAGELDAPKKSAWEIGVNFSF